MADSISIVMKMNDGVTGTLKSIASTSKGVSKEFEEMQRKTQQLGQRYSDFNKKAAETQAQALAIKKKMDEAAKAFKKTGDEAAKVNFQSFKEEYDALTASANAYSTAAKSTMKDITATQDAMRKLGNSGSGAGSGGGTGSNLGSSLMNSGLLKELSGSLSNAAAVVLESAIGQPMATMASEVVSGALSGAAAGALAGASAGSVVPGIGTAVGAGIGALSGLVSGSSQIYQAKDDAFKDYYNSLYETVSQATEEGLNNGKVLAARRETDRLSFATLLGGESEAEAFLGQVLQTANTTPFLYDDLTGISKTLLSFGYAVDDIIPTLTKVGDAGAARGLSAADIGTVATYIGRMKSSDKASLEYLNPLNARGFGVFQWLADDLGISQKKVYEKISKGDLSGTYVSDLILAKFETLYGGMMEVQSKSTEGLDSTLQGLMENIEAAGGDAYNELKNQGKNADIAAYGGELGKAMEQISAISGQNRAYQENLSAQYTREALSAVLLGEKTTVFNEEDSAALEEMAQQYAELSEQNAQGDQEAGLKMENIYEAAQALAQKAYESSDTYIAKQETELDLISEIRDLVKGAPAAFHSYNLSHELSKGQGIINYFTPDGEKADAMLRMRTGAWGSNAFGLRRVPFDGYRAILHRDEQVLTAAEARERGSGGGMQVTFSGPITVRQDSDLDEIASRLADKIELARMRAG